MFDNVSSAFFTFSANPMQLFNYVRQCLATEVRLIQAAGENFLGMPSLMVSNSGTELMHKIEVLRGRTQASFNILVVFFFNFFTSKYFIEYS